MSISSMLCKKNMLVWYNEFSKVWFDCQSFPAAIFFCQVLQSCHNEQHDAELIAGITRRSLYIFIYYNQLGLQWQRSVTYFVRLCLIALGLWGKEKKSGDGVRSVRLGSRVNAFVNMFYMWIKTALEQHTRRVPVVVWRALRTPRWFTKQADGKLVRSNR